MPRESVLLPTVINEDAWFYKENEELCKPHLGKPYISYSSVTSWLDYNPDFIKRKILGLPEQSSVYTDFGSYLGTALETGEWPAENPHGFTGHENFQAFLDDRVKGAEYEKMILIDCGEYVVIGFIDAYLPSKDGDIIVDLKTGGKGKEFQYLDKEYVQTVLYAHALETLGHKIANTLVYFVRREGSHVKPPLHIAEEQDFMTIEYSEERVKYALEKVDKAVREISSCFRTYNKLTA